MGAAVDSVGHLAEGASAYPASETRFFILRTAIGKIIFLRLNAMSCYVLRANVRSIENF